MNCLNVGNRLTFLVEHGLLEQSSEERKGVFSLTRRGNAIYQTLAIAKGLERLQDTAKTMNEALQTFPIVSDEARDPVQRRR
jgi:predicted transcriptional regulator